MTCGSIRICTFFSSTGRIIERVPSFGGKSWDTFGGLDSCPTASLTGVSATQSGTISFTSNMTYTTLSSTTVSLKMNIPVSCISPATCADLHAQYQTQVGTDFQSASCAGSGACACSFVAVPMADNESGSYAISGTTLTTTSSTGVPTSTAYCVQGTTAHLLDVDMTMNMGSMGQVKIRADATPKKQ